MSSQGVPHEGCPFGKPECRVVGLPHLHQRTNMLSGVRQTQCKILSLYYFQAVRGLVCNLQENVSHNSRYSSKYGQVDADKQSHTHTNGHAHTNGHVEGKLPNGTSDGKPPLSPPVTRSQLRAQQPN